MPFPTEDTTHVADGLALRIGEYLSDVNLAALLTAALLEVQAIEDMLWDVIQSQWLSRTFPAGTNQGELDGPPDVALLQIADLLQAPSGTWTTRQLVLLLQVWILARKSDGTAPEIVGILQAVEDIGQISYDEYYPASFRVWAIGMGTEDAPLVAPLSAALTIAKPAGVNGFFAWGDWPVIVPPTNPTAPGTFYFGDATGSIGGSGLADAHSGDWPEGLLSGVELSS